MEPYSCENHQIKEEKKASRKLHGWWSLPDSPSPSRHCAPASHSRSSLGTSQVFSPPLSYEISETLQGRRPRENKCGRWDGGSIPAESENVMGPGGLLIIQQKFCFKKWRKMHFHSSAIISCFSSRFLVVSLSVCLPLTMSAQRGSQNRSASNYFWEAPPGWEKDGEGGKKDPCTGCVDSPLFPSYSWILFSSFLVCIEHWPECYFMTTVDFGSASLLLIQTHGLLSLW